MINPQASLPRDRAIGMKMKLNQIKSNAGAKRTTRYGLDWHELKSFPRDIFFILVLLDYILLGSKTVEENSNKI